MVSTIVIVVVASTLNGNYVFSTVSINVFRKVVFLLTNFLRPVVAPTTLGDLDTINGVLVFYINAGLFNLPRIHVTGLLPTLIVTII